MKKYISIVSFVALLVVMAISGTAVAYDDSTQTSADAKLVLAPLGDFADMPPCNFNGVITSLGDTATGSSYMLYEHWGGSWCDAEKLPQDDGYGNTGDDNPGDEDDILCWAATASNMLEWTGWGFVSTFDDTDDMFKYFQDHVTDYGSLIGYGLDWWWDGTLTVPDPNWSHEDVEGGNFWAATYPYATYSAESGGLDTLQHIDTYLHEGRAVGLGIWWGPGIGHAITCWGFNYDPSVDKTTDPEDYYLGIWVTDSDNDKDGQTLPWSPPDTINYYSVSYNTTDNLWYMDNYGGVPHIGAVTGLLPFPDETRPVANAGTSYTGSEGSAITFDGSASSDADGDVLEYRWDFDNDHVWDTAWSSSPTASHTWKDDYSGNISLEVFDGRLRDVDTATVTVNNVAPVVTVDGDTIDENGTATVSGTITDPGSLDSFTVVINWGEGTPQSYNYPAGATTYNETHQYLDDNPTGTASDNYTITVTVTDDDTGAGNKSGTVTVNNVAPVVTVVGDTIDENGTATVSGTITDPGSLDSFTVVIDWGEGTPQSYNYPASATTYNETHQYLDDNPTGTASDNYTITATVTDDDTGAGNKSGTVTVNNVDPLVTNITIAQPNSQFILPAVHGLNFTGNFTDVGTQDTHTAVWDWGDMSSSPGFVSESGGSGTVTGSHTYSAPGDYTVTLTVTDDDTGSHSNTYSVHVADVDEALIITNDYIQGLDDSCFKGKADKRKVAIDNMFNALADMWTCEEYNGMIEELRNNVREKADGTVDGKAKDDWITDPTAQEEICQKIDDITAYLEKLL